MKVADSRGGAKKRQEIDAYVTKSREINISP